jgi:hypothetical protein
LIRDSVPVELKDVTEHLQVTREANAILGFARRFRLVANANSLRVLINLAVGQQDSAEFLHRVFQHFRNEPLAAAKAMEDLKKPNSAQVCYILDVLGRYCYVTLLGCPSSQRSGYII